MKGILPHILGYVFAVAVGIVVYKELRPVASPIEVSKETFQRLGNLTTSNGTVIDVMLINHPMLKCIIAVHSVPQEPGRAFSSMECK